MNTVHVALCFSDSSGSYYKHALVTAASVLANTNSPVALHLVHDETFSPEAREAFEALFAARGQRLCLHAAGNIPAETERNVLRKLGRGALFRTMLPKLLEEEKILYLDCDVVCNLDVAELWGMDLTGYYLGALRLTGEQARLHRRRLGLRGRDCINSGVMLMNLAKIRQVIPDYTERLFTIVKEHKEAIGDQGAANIFFDGREDAFLFLRERYNFRTGQKDNATLPMREYADKIIHFVGRKPWVELTTPGLWYWKYYAELFPEEDAFARMASLEAHEQEYLLSFLLRNDFLRRWVRRLYRIESKGLLRALKELIYCKKRNGSERRVNLLGRTFSYTRDKKRAKAKKGIDAEALLPAMREFKELGVAACARSPKLVVSLTSFPQRMHEIHYALYSLLKQSVKPDRVILWLGEEQFPNREGDVPAEILNFKKNGLSIRWTRDIRSYTKFIPTLRAYPDDIIVTADDDIYYPTDWLEKLWNAYSKEPGCIHCHRAHRIMFDKSGNILPYNMWNKNIQSVLPSFLNFFTGVGGVLYPQNILYKDVYEEKLYLHIAPTADDIWLWAMAVLNGVKINVVDDNIRDLTYTNPMREEESNNELTLGKINVHGSGNDVQLNNIIQYYPSIVEKLRTCL